LGSNHPPRLVETPTIWMSSSGTTIPVQVQVKIFQLGISDGKYYRPVLLRDESIDLIRGEYMYKTAHSIVIASQADPSYRETENGRSEREDVGSLGTARRHRCFVQVLGTDTEHDEESNESRDPREAFVDLSK
jgi:hypothetical protein